MLTITITPTTKGQVTATSSDGYSLTTNTPLLDGARYWLNKGLPTQTTIITQWSTGAAPYALRSTIGHAAKLTVRPNHSGTPTFQLHQDRRESTLPASAVR
jgi:hypothetical protein